MINNKPEISTNLLPQKIADRLLVHHPQTIATTLLLLDCEISKNILNNFDEDLKTELLERIEETKNVKSNALKIVKNYMQHFLQEENIKQDFTEEKKKLLKISKKSF